MENNDLIPGREIYGSDPEPGWEQYDVYDEASADFVRLQIQTGQLVDGGPELDLQLLEELRLARSVDQKAAKIVQTLCRYQAHARYLHAMNVRDNFDEVDLNDRPSEE